MKIVIRPTRLLDINQMMEVNQSCLPEHYCKDFWIQKFYEGKEHCFVVIGAGGVIGYALCDVDTIISFAILEKYRGKGIGKQLMYHCLNTYVTPVKLHVRVNNQPALHLYRSVGFTDKETITHYYNDPVEDAYVMECPKHERFETVDKITIMA
jgi:[ribosomal protein S18]-alanine N-acetyltransferase